MSVLGVVPRLVTTASNVIVAPGWTIGLWTNAVSGPIPRSCGSPIRQVVAPAFEPALVIVIVTRSPAGSAPTRDQARRPRPDAGHRDPRDDGEDDDGDRDAEDRRAVGLRCGGSLEAQRVAPLAHRLRDRDPRAAPDASVHRLRGGRRGGGRRGGRHRGHPIGARQPRLEDPDVVGAGGMPVAARVRQHVAGAERVEVGRESPDHVQHHGADALRVLLEHREHVVGGHGLGALEHPGVVVGDQGDVDDGHPELATQVGLGVLGHVDDLPAGVAEPLRLGLGREARALDHDDRAAVVDGDPVLADDVEGDPAQGRVVGLGRADVGHDRAVEERVRRGRSCGRRTGR